MKNTRMFQTFPDVVTVPELCKMLRISRNAACRLLNSGELQSVCIGGKNEVLEHIFKSPSKNQVA